MKKKNGFTLVELLATIVVILVLGLVVTPTVMSVIKSNRIKAYKEIEQRLEEAAAKYIVNEYIDTELDSINITKDELIEENYIGEVYDLEDNTECDAYVRVSNLKGMLRFYTVLTCSNYTSENTPQSLIVNLNSGESSQKIDVEYFEGEEVTLEEPTRKEFNFDGWEITSGDGKVSGNTFTMGTTKTVLEAKWKTNFVEYIDYLHSDSNLKKENGLTNSDPDQNIRYSGSNPNNYVYYNCSDKDKNGISYGGTNYNYANSCELWRVIGTFEVDNGTTTEKRVKLVRDEKLLSASWDSSYGGEGIENSINNGLGINEWSEADLKVMLNTYYIGESDSCKYCRGENQETCEESCTSSVKSLSDTSLKMIENAVWHTGGIKYSELIPLENAYAEESGTQSGKICEGTTFENGIYCTDTVERTTEWFGLVGLIYPSDYGYASTDVGCANDMVGDDSTCKNNNWLDFGNGYYWTITPLSYSRKANIVWSIRHKKNLSVPYASGFLEVFPSLYLKSSVDITGKGDGTSNNPYRLSI